jgi:hypothetical protein
MGYTKIIDSIKNQVGIYIIAYDISATKPIEMISSTLKNFRSLYHDDEEPISFFLVATNSENADKASNAMESIVEDIAMNVRKSTDANIELSIFVDVHNGQSAKKSIDKLKESIAKVGKQWIQMIPIAFE